MWGVLRAARPSGRRFSPLLLLRRSTHNSREIPLALPAVCIWGANTGVGKTLVSAGLVAAAVRNQVAVQYIKPVQTGFPADCDARLVAAAAAASAGEAAAAALLPARRSTTLFAYADPVGPHLAAAEERRVVADADIVAGVAAQLQQFTAELAGGGSSGGSSSRGLSVVETAGGVASPGPSGSLQGDLLRPLHLPALLVGDPALGGISTTLSAYESLLLRGQAPVALVMMADGRLNNVAAVRQQLRHAAAHRLGEALPVLELPLCRPPPASRSPATPGEDSHAVLIDAELAAWLAASQPQFDELLALLQSQHESRLAWLRGAAGAASSAVWWPFTQHAQLPSGDVTVVDARCGEDWLVYRPQQQQQQQQQQQAQGPDSSSSSSSSSEALVPLHDAASSWWTQTAAGPQLQLEVARAAAAAAGRYCHVMWPQVAHAPGLKLSQALLSGPLGAGWAGRVFFSDDGSTAVEVALKMAFRKFMVDACLLDRHDTRLEVLALTNSYHGDTLGAMDCAAASAFNGRLQSPWYSGRGLFLQPPTLQLQQGQWRLQQPDWLQQLQQQHNLGSADWAWANRQDALDVQQRHSSVLYCLYSQHINAAIQQHEAAAGSSSDGAVRLGALLMEPVLQGAGGMLLIDPLFQAALVAACRSRRIPVIYDEVFAGCWRLGSPTAGRLLGPGAAPDIACYAKLLTAGVAPLAVTLASEAVFEAFSGPSKAEALLHGHSYTAYPLGCSAAMAALQLLTDPGINPNVCTPQLPGRCCKAASGGDACSSPCGNLLQQWDEAAAAQLSHHKRVKGVVVLGSVLAVELAAAPAGGSSTTTTGSGGGYGSSAAVDVVAALRRRGVFARPLGPVVYLMVTPTTEPGVTERLLGQLREVLDSEEGWGQAGGDWVLI